MEALFEAGLPVAVVLADRPCAALSLAADRGAAVELVDRGAYGGYDDGFDREGFTATVAATLVAHQVDLVAMAGFGTVLTEAVHRAFPNRILNTHPALLPQFPGWHAVRDALAAGVRETGCTVHLATLEMDAGPILAQKEVRVVAGDTVETLHERIKMVERVLYPATVAWALEELEAGREIAPPVGAIPRTDFSIAEGGTGSEPTRRSWAPRSGAGLAPRDVTAAPVTRHHDRRDAARRHHFHADVASPPPRGEGPRVRRGPLLRPLLRPGRALVQVAVSHAVPASPPGRDVPVHALPSARPGTRRA